MICNIEDKRPLKRAKQGKEAAATSGKLIERSKVTSWKQAINQMAVAYPDRFTNHLSNTYLKGPHTKYLTR